MIFFPYQQHRRRLIDGVHATGKAVFAFIFSLLFLPSFPHTLPSTFWRRRKKKNPPQKLLCVCVSRVPCAISHRFLFWRRRCRRRRRRESRVNYIFLPTVPTYFLCWWVPAYACVRLLLSNPRWDLSLSTPHSPLSFPVSVRRWRKERSKWI